jgi:SAM-dependent methyltransferase
MADNRQAWNAQRIAAQYRDDDRLQAGELAALGLVGQAVRGRPILDLGVGAGRTTAALRAISADYIGIDFAADMVAACRDRHPGADIRHMDARDLSVFADGHFGLALFAFNGLDYVGHADRMRILAELHRVIAADGWLLFSSHNRARPPRRPWHPGLLRAAAGQANPARGLAGWLVGIGRHLVRRRLEQSHPGYAILNDEAHNFRLLTYYIGVDAQCAQLAEAGFRLIAAFGEHGRRIGPDDRAPDCAWVNYLARKAVA